MSLVEVDFTLCGGLLCVGDLFGGDFWPFPELHTAAMWPDFFASSTGDSNETTFRGMMVSLSTLITWLGLLPASLFL